MSAHLDDRALFDRAAGETNADATAHLESCAHCRRELAFKKELMATLRTARPPRLGRVSARAMCDRFCDAIVAEHRHAQLELRRRPLWIAVGAAGLAAAGLAILLLPRTQVPSTTVQTALTRPTEEPRQNSVLIDEMEFPFETQQELAPVPTASAPTAMEPVGTSEPATKRLAIGPDRPAPVPPSQVALQAIQPSLAVPSDPTTVAAADPLPAENTSAIAAIAEQHLDAPPGAPQTDPDGRPDAEQAEEQIQTFLARLGDTDDRELIARTLAEYKTLIVMSRRTVAPETVALSAERIAEFALPAPFDEEAAHVACESALAARSYATAYRLCCRYLEMFPRGPRARDVAYLAASVARVHLNDCRAAVERYSQAIMFSGVIGSQNDNAYLGRAICHDQLGQADYARRDLDMFVHKYPARVGSAAVQKLAARLGYRLPD